MISSDIIYTESLNKFGVVICQRIIDLLSKTIQKHNKCSMAVSGGSTPLPVYKKIIGRQYSDALDWSKVHLFFIDERCVPENDEENNFNTCYNAWLKHYPEIKYNRIEGWHNPRKTALKYEKDIKSILDIRNGIPQFDLIFMGMGEDGHIASLFPENLFENKTSRCVENIYVKSKEMDRITMTIPILNNAKNRIIGILGEKKRQIFKDLSNSDYKNYPIAKLLSSDANDTWVLY